MHQEQLDSFLESSEKLEIEGLLGGKQEETNKEIWHSEENMQKKETNLGEFRKSGKHLRKHR